jgi:phage/plasmid-like protein (TIGR03299 family)
MAFVGETPWHGLGQKLTEGASIDVWTMEAGFNWRALSAPVQFTDEHGTIRKFSQKQVIYRSDTGEPLSTMGDGYKIVQPAEVLEFFRNLVAAGNWQLHTAGILRGGRLMWAMARNCAKGDVVPGDEIRSNLLLVTSLDGTTPTTGALVATRVVCANTVKMALDEVSTQGKNGKRTLKDGAPAARVSHRSTFDASEMQAALKVAPTTFEHFMTDARKLAATPCDMAEARDLLRGVFGEPLTKKSARAALEGKPLEIIIPTADDLKSLLAAAPHVPKADLESEARDTLAKLLAKGDAREQKSVARCLELFAGAGRGANHAGV